MKSTLKLIMALPKQHFNYPGHTRQIYLYIVVMLVGAFLFSLEWVRPHHLIHISL